MTNKNSLLLIIIGVITLFGCVGVVTYAYFSGSTNLTNGNLSTNANISELNYYFQAAGENDIELEITYSNMQTQRQGNIAASDNTNMNITFTSGKEDLDMYCTYDLVWVWDETEVVKNRYIKTTGATAEYTVSGTSGSQSFSEKQVNDYGTNTVLYTGYIISSSVIETEQTWEINASFHNLELNQNALSDASFKSKVKVENVNCEVGQPIRSQIYGGFNNMILADNGGVEQIEAKGIPDFNTISPTDGGTEKATYETSSRGMYAAEDDFGTSYYYRGNVENNWVKLDGTTTDMFFRIIRINGDGSVRMIYSGETAPTQETKAVMEDSGIGTNFYNVISDNAEYVGYKYTIGEAHGTSVASTIKGEDSNYPGDATIDSWYIDNILSNSKYVNVISQEQVLCNDRTSYTDSSGTTLGGGTGNTTTYYAPNVRLITNQTPTLECLATNDAFTSSIASTGNKSLQYPVGLITADEIAMAGAKYSSANYGFYLCLGFSYWTMTPSYSNFFGDNSVFIMAYGGYLSSDGVSNSNDIRPVISLKSDIAVTGTGQWNDPYVVDGT